jgi:hypothetical protein
MNINALKTVIPLLIYSGFASIKASFEHIKSQKCMKLFYMTCSMNLCYNFCILEPLGHELYINFHAKTLKTMLHLLVYSSFLSFVAYFNK